MKLAHELKLLARLAQIDKIPYVNNGGCAIVALATTEYLNSTFNVNAQTVFLLQDNDVHSIYRLSNNLPDSCLHAVVKVGNTYYDSSSRYTLKTLEKSWGRLVHIPVTPTLIEESLKVHSWNKAFNREDHVPTIEKVFAMKLDIAI